MPPRHALRVDLDRRLLAFAALSWNAYEAVYSLQQFAALIPVYARNVQSVYGMAGIGDARRAWGVAADLVAAMAGAAPTKATLLAFGFDEVERVEHIIPFGGDFALASSPVLRRLDFRAAILGDVSAVLRAAAEHDSVAKPMLEQFQEEIRSYDLEASSSVDEEIGAFCTFRELLRELDDVPQDFPMWDGRPMFLDEQKGLLDYLAKNAGAEIVADALVDEPLGEFFLRSSGIIRSSEVTGEPVFELNLVPHRLLDRPIDLVCHQAGNAVLDALHAFDADADVLDRLFVVETAVREALGVDISAALASTRQLAVERHLHGFVGNIIDVTDAAIAKRVQGEATPYEFPDLSEDR